MSRYDGLIIPRSYSEYINKTDAATLSQALQLSGVMDAAPTENSNKAARSGGIYDAIDAVKPVDTVTLNNMKAVTSNAVYNNLITLLRTNNFRVFTIAGDGNHRAVKISYNGSLHNTALGFFIVTRYSVLIVHVEITTNSRFFRVKKNVLVETSTGDTAVTNTTNDITITEPYSWNVYNIIVLSGDQNIWSNLSISLA